MNNLKKALSSGKFFSATFIKADGTERKMLCRAGVRKHLKGGTSRNVNPDHVIVWDVQNRGYRTLNTKTIKNIVYAGN